MAIKLIKRRTEKIAGETVPVPPEPLAFPQELLTIREAMAIAKTSDSTIRRWIRNGQLCAYKAGGQVRIDRSDLVNFLQPWSPKNTCEHLK